LLRRLDEPQAPVRQVVIEPTLTVRASTVQTAPAGEDAT